jgi:hypothetical protein
MNTRVRAFLSSLMFLVLLAAAGCSSSTTPPSNNNTNAAFTKPKMGSTFTDSMYTKDTNLVDVQASGTTNTYTVIDTNHTVGAVTNVWVFASPTDTLFTHYESNGDLSTYASFGAGSFIVGSEWVTLPFATQSNGTITTFKGFVLDTVTISGTTKGAGFETVVVGSQSLAIKKATITVDAASASAAGGHIPGTVNASYAPSIGYVTRQEQTTTGSAAGFPLTGGSTRFLISYTLK